MAFNKTLLPTSKYVLIPAGEHDAVLHAVIDLGKQERGVYQGAALPPANLVQLVFEVPSVTNEEGVSATISSAELALSKSERSNFFKFISALEARNGKKTTETSLAATMSSSKDMRALLGLPISLVVAHKETKAGHTIAIIDSFSKLHSKLEAPTPTREPVFFEFGVSTPKEFSKLTRRTQSKIVSALNANELESEILQNYYEQQEKFEANKKQSDTGSKEIF